MAVKFCKECNEKKEIHAHGKCYRCYKRHYKSPKITCKICGEVKEHHSRGMCHNCVQKRHYYKHIKTYNIRKLHNIDLKTWKEVTKKCFLCGFDKIVDLHHLDYTHKNNSKCNLIGLCPNHHKMVHDMRFKDEINTQIRQKTAEKYTIY